MSGFTTFAFASPRIFLAWLCKFSLSVTVMSNDLAKFNALVDILPSGAISISLSATAFLYTGFFVFKTVITPD